jgi:NTP pyrophosphatase (non-canonical NTP hydrolase)
MEIEELIKDVEKVSQTYAKKFNIKRDKHWYILKLQEEMGELIQSYLMMVGKSRKKGKSKEELQDDFRKEIADVFCHVLLVAHSNKVDLKKEVDEKWLKWNKKK